MLEEIRALIEEGRQQAAATVNATMTLLYWRIGKRINQEVLHEQRAEYGKQIVSTLAKRLEMDYGRGFSEKSLRHMMRFAEAFPDGQIVSSLMRQLSWTHLLAIIYLKDSLQREFYAEMCRIEGWNTRTLQKKIGSMLYERTALSRKPEELARKDLSSLRTEDRLTPDLVFRDPYLLDFLGLSGAFQEKDLEAAVLREMEAFILELGTGFAFVARQKRIALDGDDYHIDLLFYHRRLRRLVAIDLKLDEFRPAHKGQMELYLRWLDRFERQPQRIHRLELFFVRGRNRNRLNCWNWGIRNPRRRVSCRTATVELLRDRLHKAIAMARSRLIGEENEDREKQ